VSQTGFCEVSVLGSTEGTMPQAGIKRTQRIGRWGQKVKTPWISDWVGEAGTEEGGRQVKEVPRVLTEATVQ